MTKLLPGKAQEFLWEAAACLSDECLYWPNLDHGLRPTVIYSGKGMNASRAVWLLATMTEDTGGLGVLHSCGQGEQGCVNIRHLYLGDQVQNGLDAYRKHGRVPSFVPPQRRRRPTEWNGQGNPSAKVTPSQVLQIRERAASGERYASLAEAFGLTDTGIGAIVRRKVWKQI